MIAVKAYPMLYDGAGMHEMLGLEKAAIEREAARGDRRALAEYFLRKMDYASLGNTVASGGLYHGAFQAEKTTKQPIEHIHHAMKEDIESKWQKPGLDDKQAGEMIFADMLQNGAGEYLDLFAKDVKKEFGIRL